MAEDANTHIAQAQAHLAAALSTLGAELRAYPTPVSGCDAQYNYLISERNRIAGALAALAQTPFVATPRTPYAGAGVESR